MRAFLIALIAVLTAGLAGCGAGGSDAGPARTASAPRASAPAPGPSESAATAYIRALYSSSGQDDGPGEWAERVRPYATKAWLAKLREKKGADAGGAGDDWPQVKRLDLRPRFDRLDARRVAEAPNTADRRYIRVIYSLGYVDEDGKKAAGLGSGGPRPRILVLTRSGDDWRVSDDQTNRAG